MLTSRLSSTLLKPRFHKSTTEAASQRNGNITTLSVPMRAQSETSARDGSSLALLTGGITVSVMCGNSRLISDCFLYVWAM